MSKTKDPYKIKNQMCRLFGHWWDKSEDSRQKCLRGCGATRYRMISIEIDKNDKKRWVIT